MSHETKVCYSCKKSKLLFDFYKDKSRKDGHCSKCKSCYANDFLKNRDAKLSSSKEWAHKNKERKNQHSQKWKLKNKEHLSSYEKQKQKLFPEISAAKSNIKRARSINAMPQWADTKQMQIEYSLAKWCSEVMGEHYQVDHIVPLKSDRVCGLHVQSNLQVIPRSVNYKKGNRVWPDMWSENA
jgi:hypothetical protein